MHAYYDDIIRLKLKMSIKGNAQKYHHLIFCSMMEGDLQIPYTLQLWKRNIQHFIIQYIGYLFQEVHINH